MTGKTQTTTPKAFDQKSRMRLIEHGDEWVHIKGPEQVSFSSTPHVLLRSIKTGYLKWWPHEQN